MRISAIIFSWFVATSTITAASPFVLLHSLVNDTTNTSRLGLSVAIDGDLAVAGAPYDDKGAIDSGIVNVYSTRTGALLHTITNPTPAVGDLFGSSVAMSGKRLVVGAYQDNTGATDAGCAYVFDLASANPNARCLVLTNPTPTSGDWFGIKVAMSGNVVVIGAVWNDTAALNSGSAYVYYLSSSVPFRPVLTIPNPSADEQDYFGNGIAIDGPRLAVAAESDDTAAYDSGIVHVFDLSRSLASTPVLSITHPAPKSGDIFGSSVALAGSVLVVGALRDDTGTEEAGAAYVYDLAGSSPRVPILTLTNPTPGFVDYFGKVAAFGRRILVSASLDDTLGENAGIAYVYDLDSATPAIPVTTLSSPRPAAKDVFGVSLGFDGVRAIIGAAQSIPFQEGAGAAYIFGQPILSVARSDAGIANVSWIPTNAADFTLQFADSLPATNWSDYPTQTNPLRAEATNRFQLFRLIDRTLSRKPQTLR